MCPSGDRLTSRMGLIGPYDYFFHLLNLKLKISHGGVTRIFFENNGRSSAYSLRKEGSLQANHKQEKDQIQHNQTTKGARNKTTQDLKLTGSPTQTLSQQS
jgi:hypothetical protein